MFKTKQHKWKYENGSFQHYINECKHMIRTNNEEIRQKQAANKAIQECIDLLESNIEEVDDAL